MGKFFRRLFVGVVFVYGVLALIIPINLVFFNGSLFARIGITAESQTIILFFMVVVAFVLLVIVGLVCSREAK